MDAVKIIGIDVYVVKATLDTPFTFSQGWVHQHAATPVKLTTESGIEGWGEAIAQGLEPAEIAETTISYALAPLILGKSALRTGALWQSMYNQTREHGRKGSVKSAVSAVDIALWDVCGEHYGASISSLLGSACHSTVEPYATGLYRLQGRGESSRLADEAVVSPFHINPARVLI